MKYLTGNVELPEASATFAYILAAALIQGMLLSWSPLFFAVSVAHIGILSTAIVWVLLGRKFYFNRIFVPVALISAWGLLQILANSTRSQWLTRQATLTWFVSGVAFLLAATILQNEALRERFFTLILWAVSILSIVAILQYHQQPIYVFGLFPAESTVVGTFLYKNQFAAMLELAAPIALYRMVEMENQEWYGAGAFALMFGAAVGASSRAGVLLLSLELVLALAIVAKRRLLPWRNLLLLSGGLLAMVSAASTLAGTQSIAEHFQEQSPYSIRQKLLKSTLRMVKEKPILGYGLGTWPEVYPAFATFDNAKLANEAHNDWAQWSAEGGVPFALLLAWLTFSIARPAARSIWGMGVLAVMAQSFVDYPTREPVLAIFWFVLAGALSRYRDPLDSRPG